jgi:pimeloyl-ACP methyl ester carboxylesterase
LRRGILHNAVQREDGSWVWRYARFRAGEMGGAPDFEKWWDAISGFTMPMLLVRALAWSVVGDEDVEELLRRQPSCQVIGVEDAGHSIQGDQPRELATILSDFIFPDAG